MSHLPNKTPLPNYTRWNLLCFGLLALLVGRSQTDAPGLLTLWFCTGWLLGMIGLKTISLILGLFCREVSVRHGSNAIRNTLSVGFLPLLPFTGLAYLAHFLLGWNAATTFASAGLMLCGGATTTALQRLVPENRAIRFALIPTLSATGLTFAWLLTISLLGSYLRGRP